jgi:hypothetical protein
MKKQFTKILILVFVLGLVPINFSNAANIATRLKGRILLQVESNGEAWYVNPDNENRYYLGRPADAFQIMRELGLGISNKDFDSFKGFALRRLSGKILLKVEDSGKAYYVNPVDLKMHYLGRPADAFEIMRNLGLGISNQDLGNIPNTESMQNINNTSVINIFYPYIVQLKCEKGYGSGTIIEPGTILTNFHVIEGSSFCDIGFTVDMNKEPQNWTRGTIKLIDQINDRAIIETDNELANKTIKKCDATNTNISDELYVLGYPGVGGKTLTVTNGIISGFEDIYIKTSAKISYGNSGGAVISKNGCFLGIPTEFKKIGTADLMGYIIDERINGLNKEGDDFISAENYLNEIVTQNEQDTAKYAKEKEEYIEFINDFNTIINNLNNFSNSYILVFNNTRDENFNAANSELEKMKKSILDSLPISNNMQPVEALFDEMNQIKNGVSLLLTAASYTTDNLDLFVYQYELAMKDNSSTSYAFSTYKIAYSWYKKYLDLSTEINNKKNILQEKGETIFNN